MQSFCDLETDSMQAARFAPPAAPTPAPAADSWLTRLARHLGASAVDQTERFISPAIRCP